MYTASSDQSLPILEIQKIPLKIYVGIIGHACKNSALHQMLRQTDKLYNNIIEPI